MLLRSGKPFQARVGTGGELLADFRVESIIDRLSRPSVLLTGLTAKSAYAFSACEAKTAHDRFRRAPLVSALLSDDWNEGARLLRKRSNGVNLAGCIKLTLGETWPRAS